MVKIIVLLALIFNIYTMFPILSYIRSFLEKAIRTIKISGETEVESAELSMCPNSLDKIYEYQFSNILIISLLFTL